MKPGKRETRMTALPAFVRFQRDLLALCRHAPWLPLAAIVGEAVQHVVETTFGMYVRGDGIQAGVETNVRIIAIVFKVIGFVGTIALTSRMARRLTRSGVLTSEPLRRPIALAAVLVLVGCHYALNYRAVGKSSVVVDVLVGVDVLVIGWLAMTLALALPRSRSLATSAS